MAIPTHCPKDHVYDEANTYWQVRQNGTKTATCRTCQRIKMRCKRESNPSYSRDIMRNWRSKNQKRDRLNWTELRKSKKIWLDEQRKNGCSKCPENDPVCIDFHHRDPKDKEGSLSEAIARWSLERLQKEVAKCDLLCSNCHRKLHASERA